MKRGSGILLHISSLPSPYGIGDFGPQAYRFVDFLKKTKQRYWQILPLTPTDINYGNSPYSSPSAFAGNVLFISPELLYKDGLLNKADLRQGITFSKNKTEYKKATIFKTRILKKAFQTYQKTKNQYKAFRRFCHEHTYWLNDYALFVFLKRQYKQKLWNQWSEDIKTRNPDILEEIREKNPLEIEEIKFYQFLFYSQWFSLKKYCRKNRINTVGDIPIYVNFDSADVWQNNSIFKLDKRLNPEFVAGVPPDYFSKTGQRWGNPVYDWGILRKQNYDWWLKRIGHNLKLFDCLRIDHFRGFVAYWQVPAKETTAIHGRWVKVPGHDFFRRVKRRFPNARIIAEDIGYITPTVRKLIKDTGFPGMKVLQFAFGADQYNNEYLPSTYKKNCVAYTGTHDNNTIQGWFFNEISPNQRAAMVKFLGSKIDKKKIHWKFIELLMRSKADVVIIPMQDILGLKARARMNTPATVKNNWIWRLDGELLKTNTMKRILEMISFSSRS